MNQISNSEEEVKEYQSRFKALYIVVGFASLIIVSRLWFLQIYQGEELREYSEKNRVKETKVLAPRGLILDRDGKVLVDNLPGFDVSITPQYAKKLDETATAVGEIINTPAAKIINDVKKGRRRDGPFRPIRLKDNLSLEEVYRLKLLRWDHPGLNINETVIRHYPLGPNGAQMFGYVGEIAREQIERLNQKYANRITFEQGDIIGQSGLELTWEQKIRGTDGIWYLEVDARGREANADTPRFLGLKPRNAVPGSNLVLTIDKDIQEAAYKAMFRDDVYGNRVGGVVVMKSNGEVLAWVNTPSFDPNEFTTGISNEVWDSLANNKLKPLRDKIIQDHFSPGSTFKPIVAVAALQEKIITPTTLVHAPAFIKFGRRIYHDHTKTGQGYITVLEAIERSSNVFFYRMGISLGIDKIAAYARALGLGEKSHIELPHEVSGLIPSSEWKLRTMGEEWQPGENLSNAIGQGFILTTALQMAIAYNTIALEGKVVKPFIVKKIMNVDNNVDQEFQPVIVRDVSKDPFKGVTVDPKTFQVVKEGMRRVANGNSGTARWWKVPGVEMAGKTGTSQVRSFSSEEIYDKCELHRFELRHHGWFVAYAPAEAPEIVIAVLAEHACHGNTGGAPVARDILMAYTQKYHPEKLKKDVQSRTPAAKSHAPILEENSDE
ncbi:MAG: penicillin-binding protein 2 [Bdellovibrionales bacterium]|nr:penicillin-binding protein 2 [Bdellovibrionales bacterium]